MNDEEHNEILESAPRRFPVESFLQLRQAGVSAEDALDALGFQMTDLSFAQRAILTVDPDDEKMLESLGALF